MFAVTVLAPMQCPEGCEGGEHMVNVADGAEYECCDCGARLELDVAWGMFSLDSRAAST